MKLVAVSLAESSLEIVIEGEGNTLLNLLRDTLLDDEKVIFASYVMDHPMKSSPRLALKTDGKSAITSLAEASSKLASLVEEFEGKFARSFEGQK